MRSAGKSRRSCGSWERFPGFDRGAIRDTGDARARNAFGRHHDAENGRSRRARFRRRRRNWRRHRQTARRGGRVGSGRRRERGKGGGRGEIHCRRGRSRGGSRRRRRRSPAMRGRDTRRGAALRQADDAGQFGRDRDAGRQGRGSRSRALGTRPQDQFHRHVPDVQIRHAAVARGGRRLGRQHRLQPRAFRPAWTRRLLLDESGDHPFHARAHVFYKSRRYNHAKTLRAAGVNRVLLYLSPILRASSDNVG